MNGIMRRRNSLQMATQNGFDLVCGTAVAVGTTLTVPVPSGYYCHMYLSELAAGHELDNGHLRQWYRDQYGMFRIRQSYGGSEKQSSDPFASTFYVTQTADQLTLNCTNVNTSGLLVDGDTWTYVAWKAAE